MRIRTREDGFEYQVREMVLKFAKDLKETIEEDYDGDINEALWKEKEEFGEIALNIIWEYFGDELTSAIYENFKEREELEEDEE